MKGKSKNKRKIGKVILIGMGFFLTIILTFTTTLAWFYDSDWASKYITMSGTVGIEIRRELQDGEDPETTDLKTSGSGNLYFQITTDRAYPGQAVNVSASVYNNGGDSVANGTSAGSPCYVRAHFAVYTNIGKVDPDDYPGGETDPDYIKDLEQAQNEAAAFDADALYAFLDSLISTQNSSGSGYYWQYYTQTGALPLSASGTSNEDIEYYLDGQKYKDGTHDNANEEATNVDNITTIIDKGYFYLCQDSNGVLLPLNVGSEAVFLWNNTFVIPWTLTNASADKLIFVAVTFQAIQTYIPQIIMDGSASTGIISANKDNQVPADQCTYNSVSVQTVFNSCEFTPINTEMNVNGEIIDFNSGDFFVSNRKQ